MKKIKKLQWARVLVQILFFIFFPALFSQAFLGIKNIFSAFGLGKPFTWDNIILTLVVLCAVTILAGRIFCGWVCAFGAVGDWIYLLSSWIQKKTGKKLMKMPEKMQLVLQKVKYVVLLFLIILCFMKKESLISENSPWTVFSLLQVGNFSFLNHMIGLLLLIVIVLGMFLQERFFCQFFCPMGAVFSLLPNLPFLYIRRGKNCIRGCQACKRNCPVSLKLQENPSRDGECICCGKCKVICPRKNIRFLGRKGEKQKVEKN